MTVIAFIQGTPIWVWLLLVYLLNRGIAALSDREMPVWRLFLMPVIFSGLALYNVLTIAHRQALTYTFVLSGLAGVFLGATVGWWLWSSQPKLQKRPNSNVVVRAGTPLLLIQIIITFAAKFSLAYMTIMYSGLLQTSMFSGLYGLINGAVSSIFWGGLLGQLLPFYQHKESP